jgi:hypothetical protein
MRISKKLRADIVKIYAMILLDYETAAVWKDRHNDKYQYQYWHAKAGAKWDVLQILLNIDNMSEVIKLTHKIVREHKRLVE